jgi:soluble lytic murein transglycosylase
MRRFLVLLLATAMPAEAEVRIRVGPDGTRHMYNVGAASPRQARLGRPTRPPAIPDLDGLIERYARRSTLDSDLVRAVIAVESDFDPDAVSRKGAMGLMQLMPATADELAVGDPFDPEENLRGGTEYLRRMLDGFGGQLELALAAYNAGPDAVRRFDGVPPFDETVAYVERVVRLYRGDPGYRVRASGGLGRGRRTYLSRGPDGRLLLSTMPPTR